MRKDRQDLVKTTFNLTLREAGLVADALREAHNQALAYERRAYTARSLEVAREATARTNTVGSLLALFEGVIGDDGVDLEDL